MKKSSSEKQELSRKVESISIEKEKALSAEMEKKDKKIEEKDQELFDLRQVSEIKERKLECDIKQAVEERIQIVTELKIDIENLRAGIVGKQSDISKLEKEKREITLTCDKSKKQIEELEKERNKLKEVLNKLETEKKSNNFGKYEKEKMKMELENVNKEKQTIASRMDELNKEKICLSEKIKELEKSDIIKKELSEKNEELNLTLAELKTKYKELEINVKKGKDQLKMNEKTTGDKILSLSEEKETLNTRISVLESEVQKLEKDLKSSRSEQIRTKTCLEEKEKQFQSMQKDDKSKVLSDRITQLEKHKYDLDTRISQLESDKSSLGKKVSELEKDKFGLENKIKEQEKTVTELTKKLAEAESSVQKLSSASGQPGDKKSKDELSKLHKENMELRKEKDDLTKTLKIIEKDLKKNAKESKPSKVQSELKKMVERLEKNGSLVGTHELENGLPGNEKELDELKTNFESLQKDLESRTSEIEKLTSQLSRSKTDCNSAVEKLRISESDLGQIKEKNAQLSDELLNKSRTITAMENCRPGTSSKQVEDLQIQVDELKRKLADAQSSKPKKSVKFTDEPEVCKDLELSNRVKELEEQLDAAYKERNEILNSCRNEVEFHRTIASELEVSIMEDFEWKLHEIEKDYNMKLKQSKEKVDDQIKEACIGILREKDEEIHKLQVQVKNNFNTFGLKCFLNIEHVINIYIFTVLY